MQTVTIDEAATKLSQLVDRAAAGEEVVLTRGGHPVAKLVAVPHATLPRTPGTLRGQIHLADDFDAPLPPEILDAFSGGA
ncbi:MAG TPA: type II toxin-antitoxin system Phd/YefM family antitoxin [Chloroflexota bacterium]|jgi:prevent-host-death family protein